MENVIANSSEAVNQTGDGEVSKIIFTWYDYTLFCTTLALSVVIGVYFGFIRKQATSNDYLLGGRTMKPLPIALSLVASQISGIALLAIPTDIYRFGVNYAISCVSVALTAFINAYVYLPVFHQLKLTSTYEYLKMRFDNRVRVLASFLFGLGVFMHLPLVIYVPALALKKVTDFDIEIITPIICAVCIFYTTIGGLKAVVWTDMLQFSITLGALIAVFALGVIAAGGFEVVFQKAYDGERLQIDFDLNPMVRDSFWVMIFGWTISNLSHIAVTQSCVQKFMAVPTIHDARIALVIYIIGAVLIKITCIITGLIMYAKYINCDPLMAGQIDKSDEILPHYVMDVSHSVPGLPGLFIAGIFCASLSTLSASMNCLAGTIYEDFVAFYMPKSITQKTVSNILKGLVVIIGIISVLLVQVVKQMGSLLPLIISFTGVATGPLLGVVTLGILFPRANSKGALCGAITGLTLIFSVFIGMQYYKYIKWFVDIPKPLSVDGCKGNITFNATEDKNDWVPAIFRISFYYYTAFGTAVTIIVGNVISLLCPDDSPPVHPDLLSPIIRPFFTDKKKVDYHKVDKALQMVTYEKN